MAYINNTPIGNMTCDQCFEASTSGMGTCTPQVNACLNNSSCSGLVQCINNCASGDQNCVNACANQFSAGIALYNAIPQCVCDTACMTECGAEPFCQPSTSSSSSVGAAATVGVGGGGPVATGAGVGGAGVVGAGGAGNGWSAGNESGKHNFDGNVVSSSCAFVANGDASQRGAFAAWLMALGLGAVAGRRRRPRA
jgi:MYXO-CTERM domain-containing protein